MTLSPLSQTKFSVIFSISWVLIFADLALLLRWFGLPWKIAIIDSTISTILLLLLSLMIMNTLRFYTPGRGRYLNILVWCLFLMGIWLGVSRWLLLLIGRHFEGYTDFLQSSLPVRGSIGLLLLGCMSLITVVWLTSEEQKETGKRKTDAEKLAREAELFKLRQQLQPHFLFNSLNSINALIGSEPEQARKMIHQLSDFLRGTLKKEEHHWVSLDEELQHLQLYLEIEKVRFGHRLNTEIITDNARGCFLPPMLLQPIVENAIKFGLYDTTDAITIRIVAERHEENLLLTVQNPFSPETASPAHGTGFGLSSVQRRLYLIFARNDLLITHAKDNIFTTILKIPQHDKSDSDR